MLDAFLISFRLRDAYKANSILYSLKSIPLIKRLLPESLYASAGLKILAHVIGAGIELGTVFVGKAFYLLVMVFLAAGGMRSPKADSFVHIFFFLTIVGGLLNTHMFNPTKDKFYAMVIMRMDARQYALSNYLYFLLKTLVGFFPFTVLLGWLVGVPMVACLLMPFLVCALKLIVTALTLLGSKDGERVRSENLPMPLVWGGVAVAVAAAYGLPFLGYAMPVWLFCILAAACIIGGLPSLFYIFRFNAYRRVYRTLLTPGQFITDGKDKTQAVQTAYHKKIDADVTKTSHKSGYVFFNELFMRRHAKLLTKSAKRLTLILLLILAAVVAVCYALPEAGAQVNDLMLTFLPYFLFIMYWVNRGRAITMAMFINCDHSMLAYRFYRQPKVILALFAQRLKYVAAINLLPASVIAIGLPLLLFLTGGTDQPLHYVLLFLSIIAMSVFFSVHTLVLYYLLQPYNIQMETKNATYSILNALTYFVCYFAIGKEVPTLYFGIGVCAFCLLYVAVALVLVYRLAPRTFRLRV